MPKRRNIPGGPEPSSKKAVKKSKKNAPEEEFQMPGVIEKLFTGDMLQDIQLWAKQKLSGNDDLIKDTAQTFDECKDEKDEWNLIQTMASAQNFKQKIELECHNRVIEFLKGREAYSKNKANRDEETWQSLGEVERKGRDYQKDIPGCWARVEARFGAETMALLQGLGSGRHHAKTCSAMAGKADSWDTWRKRINMEVYARAKNRKQGQSASIVWFPVDIKRATDQKKAPKMLTAEELDAIAAVIDDKGIIRAKETQEKQA
ncbi:hypothetical protein P170DRAFT_471149 [Aspergillus steynii IBT 23096]|uniref:Uncharacterized protein n=1 Tax=Aspergillus steynii IBT 23096 TaxID=1392250 RepID=A0A2I2GSB1_9EURO|nr:uncharacterized protein P170DRAFT_471149 [Aspergillus steynii IBT 23096]PLB55750.1 hypothetical protein P170DRAFT_471149 [Aspergillus steynii IBT 23096]